MKILLVSATKSEIAPLLKKFRKENLVSYRFEKHSVDVLVTGIGMTATAFHLGKILSAPLCESPYFCRTKMDGPSDQRYGPKGLLRRVRSDKSESSLRYDIPSDRLSAENKKSRNKFGTRYDLAINAGVAGSFRKNIPPGMVVNVVSDCFADLGAEDGERILTLKEIGLKEVRSQKSEVAGKGIRKVLPVLPQVKGITVNTVHGNAASIKKVIKKFNPDIESMEGAAFFFACDREKIPCIQIRAVSNYVERRNRKKWKMELAIENLRTSLEKILREI